jgi:two-component system, OmpR family, sensor histidine kinase KdpD
MDESDTAFAVPPGQKAVDTRPAGEAGLAAIAHDLRNALNVIEFSTTLMLENNGLDKPAVAHSLHATLRSVHHARRLVHDLVDGTADERGGFDVRPAWVPGARLLVDVRSIGGPLAARASLALTIADAQDLPFVWADAGRIAQVFGNLLDNAAKFTPAGGRITVGAASEATEVHFTVADTGPGIPEADRPHLFTAGWQANPQQQRGRGLGLSICRQIVEAHAGRIWIGSPREGGAAIVFALPGAGRNEGLDCEAGTT